MRRATLAVIGLVFVAAASAAVADVLHYAEGGKREGALQELTVFVKGVPRICMRAEVTSVAIAEDGKDVVTLRDGRRVEGKLGAVRFKLPEGVMAIARKDIKAVEVTEGTEVEEWKPPSDKPKEPEPEPETKLTPEQKQALTKNVELYKEYMEKADESKKKDIEAFSRKYKSQWDQAVRQVDSYARRIDSKLERRRTASRRSYSTSSNSRYRSEYDRLINTDQLEQDRRDLDRAKKTVSKMKKMLKEGRKQIDDRAELMEKRVASVAKGIKSEIVGGKMLSEEQMSKRYDAALKISTRSSKKK